MKLRLHLLIAGLVCLLATSCQKEFLDPGLSVTPPVDTTIIVPPRDSVTLLSKLILMKTQSGNDTLGLYEYLFDAMQRVSTINYYDHNTSAGKLSTAISYFYTGTDSLAFKKTETDTDLSYSETTWYYYNDQKKLTKDSIIFPNGTVLNNFTYSASAITNSTTIYYNADPATAVIMVSDGILDNAGHIIRTMTTGDNIDQIENTFSYDNKPNPFDQLNIRSTYNPVPAFDYYLYDNYFLKNNIDVYTTEEIIAQGPKQTTNYSYSYNAAGLPESVNISETNGPADEPRIVFVYKKI